MGTLTFEPIALLITGSQQGLAWKAPPDPDLHRPSSCTPLPWAGTAPSDLNWAPGNLPSTAPAMQRHRLPRTFCHLHCGRILRAHWKLPVRGGWGRGHCGAGSLWGRVIAGHLGWLERCPTPRWTALPTSTADHHCPAAEDAGMKLKTARILEERIHSHGGALPGDQPAQQHGQEWWMPT